MTLHPPAYYLQQQKAYHAVTKAIRDGRIVRQDCERCGWPAHDPKKLTTHAHHPNGYEPEHVFDLQWLCPTCHGEAHYKLWLAAYAERLRTYVPPARRGPA